MVKKVRTRDEGAQGWEGFLKKAGEFYETMLRAQQERQWNAAGLNAIHCAISAADAVLTHRAGRRAAGTDHRMTVLLLEQHLGKEKAGDAARHFEALIRRKNVVEYESRTCTEPEAGEMMKHAERFYRWARTQLTR